MRNAVAFLRDPAASEVDGELGEALDGGVPGWRSQGREKAKPAGRGAAVRSARCGREGGAVGTRGMNRRRPAVSRAPNRRWVEARGLVQWLRRHVDPVRPGDRSGLGPTATRAKKAGSRSGSKTPRHSRPLRSTSPTVRSANVSLRRYSATTVTPTMSTSGSINRRLRRRVDRLQRLVAPSRLPIRVEFGLMELRPVSEHHQRPPRHDPAMTSPAKSSDAASP
jgi:hypothetical protein